MIKWAESKKNIIHHAFTCMKELLLQTLQGGYRAFLTYHNKQLCSIIVIERGEDGTYLMDHEFYDPELSPYGHMEYAIIQIIEQLMREKISTFSLGLTWYPFPFAEHPKVDAEGWAWLNKQNDKKTFLHRIFQQGKTNYQFKKKFGVDGNPVFAYVPQKVSLSILHHYWPVFYQNSLTSLQLCEKINKIELDDSNSHVRIDDCRPIKTTEIEIDAQNSLGVTKVRPT